MYIQNIYTKYNDNTQCEMVKENAGYERMSDLVFLFQVENIILEARLYCPTVELS